MKQLSILVVSRTPELLSALLASLDQAWSGDAEAVEVLCSWNGSDADAGLIETGRLPFQIVQRTPYHFAANMNGLARVATGDVVVFANDDLRADPGSLDAAQARLTSDPEVGIVGAYLRTSQGEPAHVGISFSTDGSAYHRLQYFAEADHPACREERRVAAVTGAYLAMRRRDFLKLEFSEAIRVCGEDVILCLDCRRNLGLAVLYCPDMSGIHDAESTRKHIPDQAGNEEDMQAMRLSYRNTRQRASRDDLMMELMAAQEEADTLRSQSRELMDAIQQATETITSLQGSLEQQRTNRTQDRATITRLELEASIHSRDLDRLKRRLLQRENTLQRSAGG